MQRPIPIVRLCEIPRPIKHIRVVSDAVCVAAWHGAVVGVVGVDGVEGGVVVAEDDVLLFSGAVRDDEVGYGGGVGDEFCFYAWGGEGVFAVWTWGGDFGEGESEGYEEEGDE